MAYLFTIIMVLSLIAVVVFGIKSFRKTDRKKTSKSNLKFAGISLFIALAALAGVGVTAPEVDAPQKASETPQKITEPSEVESENSTVNDGLTVEGYAERINKALKEMGTKTNLKALPMSEQAEGPSLLSLSNDTTISVFTENEVVNKVSLRMKPKAFYEGNDDFKFAFILLIGTADPSLGFGDRNLILRELGLDNQQVFNEEFESSTIVGSMTFSYEGSPGTGYTLLAEW